MSVDLNHGAVFGIEPEEEGVGVFDDNQSRLIVAAEGEPLSRRLLPCFQGQLPQAGAQFGHVTT